VAAAHEVLLEMADELHAFLKPEAEARAADAFWRDRARVIQPHRLGIALQQLINDGEIDADHEVTRGGRTITTFRAGDMTGRERAIGDAAARKRLLYSRYLGWASGNKTEPGLIGPAAQWMLHMTWRDASPELGYRFENTRTGETAEVLGTAIEGGPLDHAAHVFIGNPERRYTIVAEVKSRREWLYQTSPEIYQVLVKASALQRARPDLLVVPLLVCRRAHITTFRMFSDLGGYIIETREQWLPVGHSRVPDEGLLEVRNELAFQDLRIAPSDGIHPYLRRHLVNHLPRELPERAERWASGGSQFHDQYHAMWRDETRRNIAEIREGISDVAWYGGGW